MLGIVLNDGTPLKSVEVRVDDGPWQQAAIDPATTGKYSWKLFNYTWTGATPGEHTLVSRVTDTTGQVQPTAEDLANKKSFLEDNRSIRESSCSDVTGAPFADSAIGGSEMHPPYSPRRPGPFGPGVVRLPRLPPTRLSDQSSIPPARVPATIHRQ